MLERVTDFHSHPELLHGCASASLIAGEREAKVKRKADSDPSFVDSAFNLGAPEDRFIQVLRYYLAGWHIKPKGVKKPCVPVSLARGFVARRKRALLVAATARLTPCRPPHRYNPVLGEFFRCRYDYADGSAAYYIAEQVSHHPPISAWCVSPSSLVASRRPCAPWHR